MLAGGWPDKKPSFFVLSHAIMCATMRTRRPKESVAPSPVRAYGYVRVSTEEQAHEGISLVAQQAKIKEAVAFYNFQLVEILADEGVSGKDLERPGIKRLLEVVRDREAEAVVVYKLDRLSRRTRDLLFLVEDVFVDGNTRLVSLTEQLDTETALGKFFLTLMAALAQMERELIGERTREALAYKKKKGERLGTTPLGYKILADGSLIENPEELEIVSRIKRLHYSGMPYRKIAQCLNVEGVPTKREKRWYGSTIRYILQNPRYSALS